MSDFQSSVAFLNFLKEKDGEMLMTVDEIASALENALEQTSDLHDPDHLYVPGKVVLLYNLWEKEQEQMEQGQKETQEFTSILNDWIEGLKDADVHADIELGSVAEEAILCDGTSKALSFIELDGRLLDDHMAPQYRASIANILASRK